MQLSETPDKIDIKDFGRVGKSMNRSYQLTLTRIRQLVDLNQDVINFRASFDVSSENSEAVFMGSITTQAALDEGSELTFRPSQGGQLAGEFTQANNLFDNYVLVLQSDVPVAVNVNVSVVSLPKSEATATSPSGGSGDSSGGILSMLKDRAHWMIGMAIVVLLALLGYRRYKASASEGGAGVKSLLDKFKAQPLS